MNDEIKNLWAEVQHTEKRTKAYLGYWRAGAFIQLWGAVWFVAYLTTFFFPQKAGYIWLVGDSLGIIGSIFLSRSRTADAEQQNYKIWVALCFVIAFGVLVTILLGSKPNAISVFWSCLFMTIYMIAGLWLGIRWTFLGIAISMLTVLSYMFLMPWFNLVMALLGGGGLMIGGTWLRRAS